MFLSMLGGFAQFYSDNLSHETKKEKHERKRQGMCNGLLAFGTMKGEDGVSVANPDTYPGLQLAFQLGAEGLSDREVAGALNSAGYRSTGNRGANPFTRDGVRPILRNRFYLGELPDGEGGWLPGAHDPLIDYALFEAAHEARQRRSRATGPACRRDVRVYSLSGLGTCSHCGGRIHIASEKGKDARLHCYKRRQGLDCPSKTTYLEDYENQVAAYLQTFHLPGDYRDRIMSLYAQTLDGQSDISTSLVKAAGSRALLQGAVPVLNVSSITRPRRYAPALVQRAQARPTPMQACDAVSTERTPYNETNMARTCALRPTKGSVVTLHSRTITLSRDQVALLDLLVSAVIAVPDAPFGCGHLRRVGFSWIIHDGLYNDVRVANWDDLLVLDQYDLLDLHFADDDPNDCSFVLTALASQVHARCQAATWPDGSGNVFIDVDVSDSG
jgi:hypothetical protein